MFRILIKKNDKLSIIFPNDSHYDIILINKTR